jgi:hypothetical protein
MCKSSFSIGPCKKQSPLLFHVVKKKEGHVMNKKVDQAFVAEDDAWQ